MGAISDQANQAYADGPVGAPAQPSKSDVRYLFGMVDDAFVSESTARLNGDAAAMQAADNAMTVAQQGIAPRLTEVAAGQTVALPANAYSNGTAGVGAKITASANGALSEAFFDGLAAAMAVGKRLWVALEGAKNGVYTITQLGDATHPWILTRTTDADTASKIGASIFSVAAGGATMGGKSYQCQQRSGDITIGTTALTFAMIKDESGIAGEVSTARGSSPSLGMRLDGMAVVLDASKITPLLSGIDGSTASNTGGSSASNSSNSSDAAWTSASIVPEGSVVDLVEVRVSADMPADILLVDAGTRKVLKKATYTFASGVSSVSDPFTGYIAPSPAVVFVRRTGGGYIRLAAATGRVLSVASAAYAEGDTLPAFVPTVGYALALSVRTKAAGAAVGPRAARLERGRVVNAALGVFGDEIRTVAPAAPVPAAAGSSTVDTRTAARFLGRGVLKNANITVASPSTGLLEHWRNIDGRVTLIDRMGVTLAGGANTVPVPDWSLQGETYIAYFQLSGVNVSYATGGHFYMLDSGSLSIGAVSSVAFTPLFTALIGLNVEVPRGASQYELAADGPATFDRHNFPGVTTPGKWSLTAPIAVNDGLVLAGSGGWSAFAGYNDFISIHRRKLLSRVRIDDTSSIFGLAAKPDTSASAVGGAVAMVDGVAGKLRLYAWNGSAAGTLAIETAFAAALVTGRSYLLSVAINGYQVTAALTDAVTGTVTTASGSFGASAVTARFHGRPGFLLISGNATVEWSRFAVDAPRACRALIYGDSNTEGVANGVTNPSWALQLAANGVLVSSRSGESSIDMVKRLGELSILRPKLAICAHGTNDANQTNWRINVGAFVDAALSVNAEPVLVRPPPQPAKQALMTAIDGDISSNYFGRLRSIDFLGALSASNDRLTWNASYQIGDGLHANNAGQTRMLQQAQIDIPELA